MIVKISIRQMGLEDVDEIMNIESQSFSTPWSAISFYSEIYNKNSINKVAEIDGKVCGYICVRCVQEECHLLNLAVHPDYRRRGIASLLLESVLSQIKKKGCRFIFLEVRASNIIAQKMYEKFGFTSIGIRKKYYINPEEDGIIMMKEI
jgi:ribosomal-protein-alanine N-acetyltransferase